MRHSAQHYQGSSSSTGVSSHVCSDTSETNLRISSGNSMLLSTSSAPVTISPLSYRPAGCCSDTLGHSTGTDTVKKGFAEEFVQSFQMKQMM